MLFTALAFSVGVASAMPAASDAVAARAVPSLTPNMRWDYPLGYNLTAANANASVPFYPIDGANAAASDVAGLKNANHFVACYFSAGSVESFRSDANQFPPEAVGKTMDGFPDEKWLDTRNSKVRQIMTNRINSFAAKGCLGIDADNIDGYDNDTGFNLSEADGIDFVKFLSAAAKAKGMKYGLKNGGSIVDDTVSVSDWVINEECVKFSECGDYQPFADAGKPVFHVEYTSSNSATSVDAATKAKFCGSGGQKGFSSIIKHVSLDKFIIFC